ncbi:MAG: DegV family protein [Eubacterium sp.]|nr:DegV family protein [Eubacterium sp.]
MSKVAVLTDSNSGITQSEAKELGVYVMPMPFYINEKLYYEDIDLSQEQFYELLEDDDAEITTSMPAPGDTIDTWNKILEDYYDEIVYIPMSSGLSSSCATATTLAMDEFEGKVFVVNNQRISVTQRRSVMDALRLAKEGKSGEEIKKILEEDALNASIYITVDTLKYLKKGGRLTPAVAALATLLRIKPVLQIQGEKLDTFSKARTMKQAKQIMIEALKSDIEKRFGKDAENCYIDMAYTKDKETALSFKAELEETFPGHDIIMNPLSLSVSCHIGPGALACTVSKKMQ